MRYVEIILKLAFLGISIFLLVTQNIFTPIFSLFLVISIVLGLVLMLNHHASYNFKQSKKDLIIRKIEGAILIIFAIIMSSITGF